MKKLLHKPVSTHASPPTLPSLMAEKPRGSKSRLEPGLDFSFIRLDRNIVCSNKRNVQKEGKAEGERLFQGLIRLLKDNFPPSEIENEAQYRRYFFDKYGGDWFVDVAVDNSGKVIGASLYSYSRDANLTMYNIVAVDRDKRTRSVASALVSRMIERSNRRAVEANGRGVDYVIGEIEQPDPSFTGEGARLRNHIRPMFHDNTSQIRAIRLQDGSPLIYLLPIMASDSERMNAQIAGEPYEPEPLMFCLRPVSTNEAEGISSKEAARLLIWFYKDYLEAECSDVRPDEVNALLSQSLSKLAPGIAPDRFEALLGEGKRARPEILSLIPETRLEFMKIAECRPSQP
jgi:hypothetical protein